MIHRPNDNESVSLHAPIPKNVVPHDPLQPEKCAKLLAALAAPERLKIVRLLTAGPLSFTKIAEGAGIKPLNVSHHLAVLKTAKLIRGERRGRSVLYALSPGVLEEVVIAGIPRDALNLGCCRLDLPPAADDPPEGKR